MREELAAQGAPEPVLRALDTAFPPQRPPSGRAGRVLVANAADGVLLDRTLPEPPDPPWTRWDLLPHLLPAASALADPVPAVVVRVAETGGEVLVPGSAANAETVGGRDHPVHKVRGGGWSHLSMQERVEETWRRNTAEELAAAVEEATLDLRTGETRAELQRWDGAAGRPDGLAVDGMPATVAAARAEAIDTLLVDLDVLPMARLWIGASATELAPVEDELTTLGTDPLGEADAGAALLRAAVGSGAQVHLGGGRTGLVGRPLADGVGALLRFPIA
ncbi:baeRF2 domain-containing protein [Pseudonocardia asaccharolytica]|uniref:Uncharacterized protein n=1 Tax=Pseudonocardia asaccharolytica DSM 44247 = NBRC 16224 TaxID=1123024 RepID=A0A511CXN8_9PSEU|nr:hypothetical protein [Pseudonocardia asaccharolytica]GEL17315.1 hypothetical protein PA7_11520 [Pseudonocardia asaccharolytica DSM 44247 = NBRC 16224]